MSKLKQLAIELKDANAALHHARTEFFDRANKTSYIQYWKALKLVNDLEERIGCKVDDVDRMIVRR